MVLVPGCLVGFDIVFTLRAQEIGTMNCYGEIAGEVYLFCSMSVGWKLWILFHEFLCAANPNRVYCSERELCQTGFNAASFVN